MATAFLAYIPSFHSRLVRVVGASPPPFTLFNITYKVVVYAPAERADTLPLFLLYPYMYSVRGKANERTTEYIGVETKWGECICPISWSVQCNFIRDGK